MNREPFSETKWIWTAEESPRPNTYVYFRNRLNVPDRFQKAILRVTADSLYDFYVNEKFLIHGPVRSDPRYLYYDEIDITSWLHAGSNLLASLVHYLGVGTGSYIPGPGGFLCEIEITEENGKVSACSTPQGWITRKARTYLPDSPRLNGALGFSEHIDFLNDESEWYAPSFNESDFTKPVVLGSHPRKPYLNLTRRDIPIFQEKTERPLRKTTGKESRRYDFGRLVFGRVKIELDCPRPGDVKVEYWEDIVRGEAYYQGQECMYADRISIPAAGKYVWKSFEKRAFRYIAVSGMTGNVKVSVVVYNYPVKDIGSFVCSDKVFNKIWEVSSRTLKLCIDDQYNDCPQRERAQWMDAFACAPAAFTMFGVTSLTRKFLVQYVQSQKPDGRLLAAYPSPGNATLPDYSLIYIIFLHWYLKITGDLTLVRKLYAKTVKVIKWFDHFQDKDGLIKNPPGLIFLDNTLDLMKVSKSAGLNAIYCGAITAMGALADALGQKKDARNFTRLSKKIKQKYNRVFKNPMHQNCFMDSSEMPHFQNKKYLNINFACEFGKRHGTGAKAKTFIFSAGRGSRLLSVGTYAGLRVWLNGKSVLDIARAASWERQAQYNLDPVTLNLKKGWNELTVEVEFSTLHWDVYFCFPGKTPLISVAKRRSAKATFVIEEIDWKLPTKESTGTTKIIAARPWFVPELSQTTAGLAAFFDLCQSPAKARKMLSACLPKKYYRNYLKERVPFFCVTSKDSNKLRRAILPCNNPWSAYFFLSSLFKYELKKEAFDWIRMAWGGMLKRGATTWWEEWGDHSSLCHGWGSYPAYFFQTEILGIRLDNLGRGEVTISPDLTGLSWAEGVVALNESGKETIRVKLVKKGSVVNVMVSAPERLKISFNLSRLKKYKLTKIC